MRRRVSNPPNPWLSEHCEWLGEPPAIETQVFEERARTILSRNESPDIPFRWSVNPYRGCQHACAYCYARPTHQYLGWGAGTDFDSKIVAKVNAPELLRAAFARRSWRGEPITFSGVTDCYQPVEAGYELTRSCLRVALEFHNPVTILTKSALVRRDVDVLAPLHERAGVEVYVSIPFADDWSARKMEPWASAPSTRFETLRVLSDAGIPTGVAVAPLIPGLNDAQLAEILERAAEAGARSAFLTLLRLPAEVRVVFEERLRERFPDRAQKVWSAVQDMRLGKLNESAFGRRMNGSGARWNTVRKLFEVQCRRLGLNVDRDARAPAVPPPARQGLLFEP